MPPARTTSVESLVAVIDHLLRGMAADQNADAVRYHGSARLEVKTMVDGTGLTLRVRRRCRPDQAFAIVVAEIAP